jgi:hypothetical protein
VRGTVGFARTATDGPLAAVSGLTCAAESGVHGPGGGPLSSAHGVQRVQVPGLTRAAVRLSLGISRASARLAWLRLRACGGRSCFLLASHLRVGAVVAVGDEGGVIAEAGTAEQFGGEGAVDGPLES